jgi:hypothetical protein
LATEKNVSAFAQVRHTRQTHLPKPGWLAVAGATGKTDPEAMGRRQPKSQKLPSLKWSRGGLALVSYQT